MLLDLETFGDFLIYAIQVVVVRARDNHLCWPFSLPLSRSFFNSILHYISFLWISFNVYGTSCGYVSAKEKSLFLNASAVQVNIREEGL